MLKQTLSLSQSQQLQMVLAPQLRQSLEMLQLPIMELQALIQQEIEQNPTIEEVPNSDLNTVEVEKEHEGMDDKQELEFEKEFELLSKLDDEWRDYFFQNVQNQPYTREDAEKRQFFLESVPQTESLQEHLLHQLQLTGFSEEDYQVGELIVGSIDDDGYLTADLNELAQSANCDHQHLEDILAVIQDFHPTGVGARDLRDCLLLQLSRLGKEDNLATQIVRKHLKKLGGRKYNDLAKTLNVTVEEVKDAAKFIATLDPKPGRIYSSEPATYVLPEIIVRKVEGEYVVILNDDHLPHVRISRYYQSLLKKAKTDPEVKAYVRERIRAGAFLIKSIHQRQSTIHMIATEIVKRQQAFLEHGISKLRPMTMAEVAEAVGVHETTVSRTVASKYMRTPKGIFELKYFFTPGIKMAGGKEISNMTVKDMIAEMVAEEDPAHPFSDQEIVEGLAEQGVKIARRTVAKYRLVLKIPPSHMRKSY